jgi:benzodiazapine receptor
LQSLIALMCFAAACFAAASVGWFFRPGKWYAGLAKPRWGPPKGVFAPVWTVLYLTIAFSGWLVWERAGTAVVRVPLTLYGVQLVLNAAWTPIFFGLRRPDLAFYEILLLSACVAATIATFRPIHAGAAWLLMPYFLWVSFAAALNFSIWRRNPAAAVTYRV